MRTPIEKARDALHELHNVAEHVARNATNARAELDRGLPDIAAASEFLRYARRSADDFEMRYRDAVLALEKATTPL